MRSRHAHGRGRASWLAAAGLAAAPCLSCGPDARDHGVVLAEVDGVAIRDADLERFEDGLPDHLRSSLEGEARVRDLLQALVDRELMVLEAEGRGLFREPRVQAEFRRRTAGWLTARLYQQARLDTAVDEEEARQRFEENDIGRMVYAAHIVCPTEAEARAALHRLGRGESFGDVARDVSVAPDAAQGGELRRWLTFGMLPRHVHEVVWALGPGEHTPEPVAMRGGYEIIQVQQVRYRTFEERKSIYMARLRRQKLAEARARLVAECERRLGAVVHADGWRSLRLSLETGAAPASGTTALLTWEGGQLSVGQALEDLPGGGAGPAPGDSAAVMAALRGGALGDSLLVAEARRRGLHEGEEFPRYCRQQRRELVTRALWRREVRDRVAVDEDDIRHRYETDRERFPRTGFVQLREILVERREQADSLRARIEAGQPVGALARRHSLRPRSRAREGLLHIHEEEKTRFPRLYDAARTAPAGELVGPLQVEGGFSLFEVVDRQGAGYAPFDEVRDRIELAIRRELEEGRFRDFIEDLRRRYEDRVRWRDGNIERVATENAPAA